jgi:hypothetical protein
MPRNSNAATLDTTDLEGVEEVSQGNSKFAGKVLDFTSAPKTLIPEDAEVKLQIKGARPGITNSGWPKASIMYTVDEGDYEGETFFDDLYMIPPQPPKKGTMWRFDQFCTSIDYVKPENLSGDEIAPWLRAFCEEILGEKLRAVIGINRADPNVINPKTDKPYEDRNTIKRFINAGAPTLDDIFG